MRTRILLSAAVLASVAVAPAAEANHVSPASVLVASFRLDSGGTPVFANLSMGSYNVTITGTYDYDIVRPGSQLADAECSLDNAPFWSGAQDQIAQDWKELGYPSLYPAPVSEWQRYRYGVQITDEFPFYKFFPWGADDDDQLDVYINWKPVDWIPPTPSIVDSSLGATVGCDAGTHAYETQIEVLGGYTIFQIKDFNWGDNRGTLRVKIYRLGPK